MTSGMPLVVTAAMKPIPTLMTPLDTVNLDTLGSRAGVPRAKRMCAPFPQLPWWLRGGRLLRSRRPTSTRSAAPAWRTSRLPCALTKSA